MTGVGLQRGLPNNGPCAFCDQEVEMVDHLLVGHAFSRETWFKTLRHCGWSQATPAAEDRFTDWWLRSRKWVPKLGRKAFDSLVILVA
jgi:hypothetical protein